MVVGNAAMLHAVKGSKLSKRDEDDEEDGVREQGDIAQESIERHMVDLTAASVPSKLTSKMGAKTMKEEVEAFAPFVEHISRSAVLRKQKSATIGKDAQQQPLKDLTDDEIENVGKEQGLSADTVRQCWECFKAIDRKGQGYVDSEEMQLLLVILNHMEFIEESEALSRKLKLDQSSDPDSGLRFPEFIDIFQQSCGGWASFTFRMACLKQEANSVHKMMEEAVVCNEKARSKSGDALVVGASTVEMYGVPDVHVHQYISRELREADACKQLPYALGLFLLFVYGVHLHSRADKLFAIDQSIESDLRDNANFAFAGILPLENGHVGSKGVDDVNNVPDFWSWLLAGIVPLLWIEVWDVSEVWGNTLARCTGLADLLDGFGWDKGRSEAVKNAAYSTTVSCNASAYGGPTYNAAECPSQQPGHLPVKFFGMEKQGRGMYLYFNRVIGGLRLRQERRQARACASEAYRETSTSFGAPCFDGHYWLRPDLRASIFTKDSLVDDSRTTYLRTGKSQAQIRQEIQQMENERWLDQSVQKVELAFPSLNAEIGTLTLTYIHLFLPRSGHIWKIVDPVSVCLRAYDGWWNYIVDITWVVMNCKIFFQEAREVSSSIRNLGFRKGFTDYISFWNVVDWISVLVGFVIIGIWIGFLVMLQDMEELLLTGQASLNGHWETDSELEAFFEKVTSLLEHNLLLYRMFAGYVVVCVFRFFKAFNAQPRLSIVTRTLAAAAVDILHFGISFLTVLLTFALSGHILYGQYLADFEHFDRAIFTCYRLLLGDFDFEALYDIDRFEAVAWFWSNTILLLLIMMNMLLAVIMDVYTEVKASVINDVTLFAQTKEVMVRWWRRRQGKEVHLSKVLEAVEATIELENAETQHRALDVSALMMLMPELKEEQALEILEGANALLTATDDPGSDVSMSASMVRLQEMVHRQFFIMQSLHHLLELLAVLMDQMDFADQPLEAQMSRQVSGDGEQLLDALLEKVLPANVSAAVEKAFAKRVDPVFTNLVQVRDDVAACVGELGKDFDRRFGALEIHAEHICRELEDLKNGSHTRIIPPPIREPYGVFITREERLTRRTPNSSRGAPSPAAASQRVPITDRDAAPT